MKVKQPNENSQKVWDTCMCGWQRAAAPSHTTYKNEFEADYKISEKQTMKLAEDNIGENHHEL